MIPLYRTTRAADREAIDTLLSSMRLDARQTALGYGERAAQAAAVEKILADVAERGDAAIVESARRFDDPKFTSGQIRVEPAEMREAVSRVPADQLAALRRAIGQVREYQSHIMPAPIAPLRRDGVELGLRFTPLDSAGLYFPGGKASYPSSLVMLAVPAQVAGVKTIVACSPPSPFGRSDLVLAAAAELGLTHVYRAGGAAAIAAMAFGTETIPAVDKIVGPGNAYVQLAKRLLAGSVGIDGFLGPSEIVIIADESGQPSFIAADLIAQSEHDPGSGILLTPSLSLANAVVEEIARQSARLDRAAVIDKAMTHRGAIIVTESMEQAIDLANRIAAEHVNVQAKNLDNVVAAVRHAGAIFAGPWSPVAAGDYVAGPSHCLPTNATARFSSGVSVYEFLKRTGTVKYEQSGLARDAEAIKSLAQAEGLGGHAASIENRGGESEHS